MRKLLLTVYFMMFSVIVFSQVGINTTNPTATLHVYGATVPAIPTGSFNLINQNFSTFTVTQIRTSDADCTTTNGWATSSTAPTDYVCSTCVVTILFLY